MLAPGMGQAATFQWGSIHPVFLAEEQQSHQGWDTGGGWNGQVAMPLPWLPGAWDRLFRLNKSPVPIKA